MKIKSKLILAGALGLAACAPDARDIAPTYTPSVLYQNLSCQQLAQEAWRVSNRAHDAVGLQNRHQVEDAVAVTTGLLVFWPALFFVHGTDANAAQIAQLRGEMQAIEAASAANGCGLVFNRA